MMNNNNIRLLCIVVACLFIASCQAWTAAPLSGRSSFVAKTYQQQPQQSRVILFEDATAAAAETAEEEEEEEEEELVVTGKKVKLADIAKKIGVLVRDKVTKEDYTFKDLTKWVKSSLEEKAGELTGIDDYHFGDISKEVVRKVRESDYSKDDLFMSIRMLAAAGVSVLPVAEELPAGALLNLIMIDEKGEAGSKIKAVVGNILENRINNALGDEGNDSEVAKIARAKLQEITGKDDYEFGDITRIVFDMMDADHDGKMDYESVLPKEVVKLLESWDELNLDESGDKVEEAVIAAAAEAS